MTKVSRKPWERRQEPRRLGTKQRSDNAPPAFGFSEHRRSDKPSQANKRRSRKCHGRFESHDKPSSAQVRPHVELSRNKGTNGAHHAHPPPPQSSAPQLTLRYP